MNSPLERRSFTEIFNNENNAPKKKAKNWAYLHKSWYVSKFFSKKFEKNEKIFPKKKF